MTNPAVTSTDASPTLSVEDLTALREITSDVSDIPERDQARIRAGFQDAYNKARDVRLGLRDPMSR